MEVLTQINDIRNELEELRVDCEARCSALEKLTIKEIVRMRRLRKKMEESMKATPTKQDIKDQVEAAMSTTVTDDKLCEAMKNLVTKDELNQAKLRSDETSSESMSILDLKKEIADIQEQCRAIVMKEPLPDEPKQQEQQEPEQQQHEQQQQEQEQEQQGQSLQLPGGFVIPDDDEVFQQQKRTTSKTATSTITTSIAATAKAAAESLFYHPLSISPPLMTSTPKVTSETTMTKSKKLARPFLSKIVQKRRQSTTDDSEDDEAASDQGRRKKKTKNTTDKKKEPKQKWVSPKSLEDVPQDVAELIAPFLSSDINPKEKLNAIQLAFFTYQWRKCTMKVVSATQGLATKIVAEGVRAGMWPSPAWKPSGISTDFYTYLVNKMKGNIKQAKLMRQTEMHKREIERVLAEEKHSSGIGSE